MNCKKIQQSTISWGWTHLILEKYNLILCQSKRKLNKIRKKLMETDYYTYWTEDYLKEILGDDAKYLEKPIEGDENGL